MSSNRTKEEVVALVKSLNFAPSIQVNATGLQINAPDGSQSLTIRRAPSTRTKVSNSGTR